MNKVNIYYRELKFFAIIGSIWICALFYFSSTPVAWFYEFWPIIIISFFSAAVANATAVGGGFIFLPLFSFLYDLNPLQSLKLALATQAFGMTSGALNWPRHLILWRYFFIACGAGSVGMLVGTFLWVPNSDWIHGIFGYASVALGLALLLEVKYGKTKVVTERPVITSGQMIAFIIFCILGGLITSWVSIGIGEVVAMWLLFQARYSISSSVATGVAVLAFCSLLGFVSHASLGGIEWKYLMFTSLGVILGGRAGAKSGALMANIGVNRRKKSSSSSTMNSLSDSPLKVFVALVILLDGAIILLLD